ncbi:ComF family protein [Salisaeta longa]|uniref:ComF family protein n=1 Tax=Salisaeta longa TaxID=503170 RepID=UPI0003B54AAF|nr:double zinc ribbon domain-containing protein [Salisaeta longa]
MLHEATARLGKHLSAVGRGLLDVLYPPRCLHCGDRALGPKRPLCAACLEGLERATPTAVQRRLDRLPAATRWLDGAHALWIFDKDGPLQALQHALKYGDRPAYGPPLGRLLARSCADALGPVAAVVPVPLHRVRYLERGYNQAARIAMGVAEELGVPHRPELLRRPRPTRSQTGLERAARWANVGDAFDAPEALDAAAYVLVDDVLTTGSTVAAAAKALKASGATAVYAATLALART